MPYDEEIEALLVPLKDAREAVLSALRIATEQVRGYLADCRGGSEGLAERASSELGEFARGRIDPEKFATLFLSRTAPPARSLRAIDRAATVLDELVARGDDLFVHRVEPGGDLRTIVEEALAQAGRAFGAARIVDLVRTQRYEPKQHESMLERFPFRSWNRMERRLAPPLIIDIEGADLFPSSIGDYLDGCVKIFLLVHGAAAPAPLSRLITPGTLVIQTTSVSDLAPAIATSKPAVAAVMPEGSATFLHDPEAGAHLWQRLTVTHRPGKEPRRSVGGFSAAQQAEELGILDLLGEKPAPGSAETTAGALSETGMADPAERLAAWLLQQA